MSVENGVVICFCQKDYELKSWNEQGEITTVEGMLTVAFSAIFPCSHKDNWKELYCIIKIPYLVNMPHYTTDDGTHINEIVVKEEITEDEEIELLKEALIDAYSSSEWKIFLRHYKKIIAKYKNNIDKIKEFEVKINKLETENNKLKEKIEELFKKRENIKKLKEQNIGLRELLVKDSCFWMERSLTKDL